MAEKVLTMADIGEFGFIRSIQEGCRFSPDKVIKGIGDDCAVIGPYADKLLLISTDLLVEGVHFVLDTIPPEILGRKAVAVNLSDIAAMGGEALHLFCSIAVPVQTPLRVTQSIYEGIKAMCRDYRLNLLGGDTSASRNHLMLSLTVIGEVPEAEILYRHGARPDDILYVTGTLGDAAAGLRLILGDLSAQDPFAERLKAAHHRPTPFLQAGRLIARSRLASAMIDLSDGLLSDLRHVCEASGVGAEVQQAGVPLSESLETLAAMNDLDPLDLALSGGEDYRLLVTVPGENRAAFEKVFAAGSPCRVYPVGVITAEKGLRLRKPDGSLQEVEPKGYHHF
jgi:thiamine-monophosphate kinase